MRYLLNCSLLLLTLSAAAVSHNPIIPKPQKISYGQSQFILHGISIGFTKTPSNEDLFTAGELAAILSGVLSGACSCLVDLLPFILFG